MFDTNALPQFTFADGQDFTQKNIIAHLNKYLAVKRSKLTDHVAQQNCVLPFTSEQGLCSGLTAYWLYCKCTRDEWFLIDQLEYLLNWKEDINQPEYYYSQDDSKPKIWRDDKIENFLNAIIFLQFDNKVREQVVQQVDLDKSFAVLLSDYAQQVNAPEFQTTFVFNQHSLARMLDNVVFPNKMIRLSNSYHTIGLVYSGDVYYLCDWQFKHGPKKIDNVADLSKEIFKSLGAFHKPQDYLALNLSAFDFASRPLGRYPQTKDYFAKLTNDKNYKRALLKEPHIFHLALWYKNAELANYLIEEGMDVNMPTPYGVTPLEAAFINENWPVFYKLLEFGANPQLPTSQGVKLWDLAIQQKKSPALIMLAGLCFDANHNNIRRMLFSKIDAKKEIIEQAILLNKKVLNAGNILNIPEAHIQDVIAFLQHVKLKSQLQPDYQINNLVIFLNGQEFRGKQALNKIAQYCQSLHDNDLFCVAQKKESYDLINYLMQAHFGFDYYQELLKTINAVERKITSVHNKQYSNDDLKNITTAIAQLQHLSHHIDTVNPRKLLVCYKANASKNRIKAHLAKNGIVLNKQEINQAMPIHKPKHVLFLPQNNNQMPISYEKDVAPCLKLRA